MEKELLRPEGGLFTIPSVNPKKKVGENWDFEKKKVRKTKSHFQHSNFLDLWADVIVEATVNLHSSKSIR